MASKLEHVDIPEQFAAIADTLPDLGASCEKPTPAQIMEGLHRGEGTESLAARFGITEDDVVSLYVDGRFETVRAENRAALAEFRAKMPVRLRPWWQTGDCPLWCSARHGDGDTVDDRYHLTGESQEVELTRHDPVPAEIADGNILPNVRVTRWAAETARIDLEQRVDHSAPTVLVHRGDELILRLTIMEAREIGSCLDDVANTADDAITVADRIARLAANC